MSDPLLVDASGRPTLLGLGIWIWEWSRCDGGNLDGIVALAKHAGARWLCVKAGEGGPNGQVTKLLVDRLRSEGVECVAWWYSRPATVDHELAWLAALVETTGVRHLVMDAELEWESVTTKVTGPDGSPTTKLVPHDFRSHARDYAQRLRQAVGDGVFLADAPWPIRGAHPLFPFDEFGAVVDARMPQVYFEVAEAHGEPMLRYLGDADRAWSASTRPVWPILSTVDELGAKHCPVEEFTSALERYEPRGVVSVWSYQHLNGAEWQALAARVVVAPEDPPIFAPPDTLPAPPPAAEE